MSALLALASRWRHMNFPMTTFEMQPDSDDPPEEALEFLATDALVGDIAVRHLKITLYRQLLPTHAAVLQILRHCLLLETCDVPVSGGHNPSPTHEPLTLPYLRRLSIANGRTPVEFPHFVGSLIVPALSYFHCSDDIIPSKIPASRSLFPSAALLRCLSVNIRGMSTEVLLAGLAELPTIQELHLLQEPVIVVDGDPDSKFLTHLIPLGTLTTIKCPLVQHLALENFNALTVTDDTLLQFIQSRTKPSLQRVEVKRVNNLDTVVRLSRLSCSFQRLQERNILPVLHDAIAAGLDLELQYEKVA
ncbi:hypothetical protein DFH06DRAFT_1327418 [Mycena polygramma]|nr:hypothetical protein DFH06DRAFT_1327418 [Mycena polygramma]